MNISQSIDNKSIRDVSWNNSLCGAVNGKRAFNGLVAILSYFVRPRSRGAHRKLEGPIGGLVELLNSKVIKNSDSPATKSKRNCSWDIRHNISSRRQVTVDAPDGHDSSAGVRHRAESRVCKCELSSRSSVVGERSGDRDAREVCGRSLGDVPAN